MNIPETSSVLGLDSRELEIYQYLLKKGPQKASVIATLMDYKRGITYKLLSQLVEKGLVRENDTTGKVSLFEPLHPKPLEDAYLKSSEQFRIMEQVFGGAYGELLSAYNALQGMPGVRFFEGTQGIVRALEDTLSARGDIRMFSDSEKIALYFTEVNREYVKKRHGKQMQKRVICPDTTYNREHDFRDAYTDRRFSSFHIFDHLTIQIYNSKVLFITLDPIRHIAVLVEDGYISQFFTKLFDEIWENSAAE
jgi:sugar-specific transcriptional regulator TrmB